MTSITANSFKVRARATARRVRRGLSLIEAAAVLGLLMLVVAGAMLLYQNASTNSRVAESASQLATIQEFKRPTYAGSAGFTGLQNSTIANTLPAKMNAGGGALRHAFNGTVTVLPTNTGGGTDSGFYVAFTGVPAEACQKLATMDMGRAIVGLVIGGATASTTTPPPFTPANAQNGCGTSGTTTMTWTVAG